MLPVPHHQLEISQQVVPYRIETTMALCQQRRRHRAVEVNRAAVTLTEIDTNPARHRHLSSHRIFDDDAFIAFERAGGLDEIAYVDLHLRHPTGAVTADAMGGSG